MATISEKALMTRFVADEWVNNDAHTCFDLESHHLKMYITVNFLAQSPNIK